MSIPSQVLRRLPEPWRKAAVNVGLTVGIAVICLFLLPGRGGSRGVPTAIVFAGLVAGLVNALTAAGLIVVYRTSRIINFAHTAIGAVGALVVFNFVQFTGVPFFIAFPVGLVFAALTGVVFDVVFGRRFFRSPRLVLTVVTIAGAAFLGGAATSLIDRLPFFPSAAARQLAAAQNQLTFREQLPFAGYHFQVGDFPLQFGFPEIFAIEISLIALLVVGDFFRRTRAGVGVRAMSENLERAELLGVSTGALSSVVWVLAGVLAGAGVTLTGMLTSPAEVTGAAPDVLLPALAAAVIGRMRSLPVTVAAAIGLAIVSESFSYSLQRDNSLVDFGLFLVVGVGLLLQRRVMSRSESGDATSWQASDEPRPIPAALLAVPGIRFARRALLLLGILGVAVFPFVTTTNITNLGSVIALDTVIAISVVVLTGWAGQVSLGQVGFSAVGAVLAAALTTRVGIPFWFAVPITAALTAAFAALIGLPALRIKGLFLAITTFAFAIAVHSVLFNPRYFGWLLTDEAVTRPRLFVVDFEDERSMYFLCVGALLAVAFLVGNLRRSRWGRIFIALRDNEPNVQAFGITAVHAKITAFALAGGLAGFAGAIFVHQQRTLSAETFTAQAGIDIFILAIVGGVSSVNGAFLGSAYISVTAYVVSSPLLSTLLGPGGTLLLLYAAPGGLLSLVHRARDSVLRIVAQRRQLVVPSLFEDYDAEALERRLIPLSASSDNVGLGALPATARFTLATELYDDVELYRQATVAAAEPDGHTADAMRTAAGLSPGGSSQPGGNR